MPIFCCAIGCNNRQGQRENLSFYRFPADTERKRLWIKGVNRENWEPTVYNRLCSDHFLGGEKSNNKDSPNYIPTLFQHTSIEEKNRLLKNYDMHVKKESERQNKLDMVKLLMEPYEEEQYGQDDDNDDQDDDKTFIHFEYQPDINNLLKTYSATDQSTQTLDDSYLHSLENEYYKLKNKLSVVKRKDIFRDMTLDMFLNNHEKVRCLTGLETYGMLKTLDKFVKKYQGPQLQGKLTYFQQLMLTLIKLKLNLAMPFLAILFSVSVTTISRIFKLTVDILFFQVVPRLVLWPESNVMRRLIPIQFIECENYLYSVDVFDIEIDLRGAATLCEKNDQDDAFDSFGNASHVREKKYFMGIAPQGLIIFISKGVWGGLGERVLALESGILKKVSPGDVIISSRKFDINDEIEMRGADIKICDPESSEYESKGLIPCKTVIDALKERYQILNNRMSQNWVKDTKRDNFATSDKIVHIACALLNMTNRDLNYEQCLEGV